MGDQKKTRTIKLEIYSDKFLEFLTELYFYKSNQALELSTCNRIVDCIHFDSNILKTSFGITEVEIIKVEKNLQNIFKFLFESKQDSNDYFLVSKGTLKDFECTTFGEFISTIFYLSELSKSYIGKKDHIEIQIIYLNVSMFLNDLMLERVYGDYKGMKESNLEEDKKNEKLFDQDFVESIMNSFIEFATDAKEKPKNRKNIINKIYKTLKRDYPSIGSHVSMIITGYAASCSGVLLKEEQYNEKDYNTTFRQYLKNSVSNALKTGF